MGEIEEQLQKKRFILKSFMGSAVISEVTEDGEYLDFEDVLLILAKAQEAFPLVKHRKGVYSDTSLKEIYDWFVEWLQ